MNNVRINLKRMSSRLRIERGGQLGYIILGLKLILVTFAVKST